MADMSREEILELAERFDASNEIYFTSPECRAIARALRFREAALRLLADGEKGEPALFGTINNEAGFGEIVIRDEAFIVQEMGYGFALIRAMTEPRPVIGIRYPLNAPPARSYADGVEDLTRPIIGIERRTAPEVFDIMADRIRRALAPKEG